jgi:hypothetical protein
MVGDNMRHRNERGQGLVEFALILPLLLLMIFGAVDIGRAVFAYSTLMNSVTSGARAAIVKYGPSPTCDGLGKPACAVAVTQNAAGVGFGGPVAVNAACLDSPCGIGARFQVKAEGRINLVTPLLATYVGPITVSAASTMTVEAVP